MTDPQEQQTPTQEQQKKEESESDSDDEDTRLGDVTVGSKESKLTNQRLDLSASSDVPTNPLLKSPSVRGPMIMHKHSAQPRTQTREVNRRDQKKGLNPRRPLYTGFFFFFFFFFIVI